MLQVVAEHKCADFAWVLFVSVTPDWEARNVNVGSVLLLVLLNFDPRLTGTEITDANGGRSFMLLGDFFHDDAGGCVAPRLLHSGLRRRLTNSAGFDVRSGQR